MSTDSFPVYTFCTYRKRNAESYSEAEYHAYKFVMALKGKRLNKYAWITVRGERKRLDNESAREAPRWLAMMAADALSADSGLWSAHRRTLLMPVPDSDCSRGTAAVPRNLAVASETAALLGNVRLRVVDALRWTQPMLSSRAGGPRMADELLQSLALKQELPDDHDVAILFDDVKTTGGHLVACARLLRRVGIRTIAAVCCARTVQARAEEPMEPAIEMLHY
jgi:hypothetical protein